MRSKSAAKASEQDSVAKYSIANVVADSVAMFRLWKTAMREWISGLRHRSLDAARFLFGDRPDFAYVRESVQANRDPLRHRRLTLKR
jgi:hypothetical protein